MIDLKGVAVAIMKHEKWYHAGSIHNADKDWDPVVAYPYFHNLLGNHEVYNFDRAELQSYFICPKRGTKSKSKSIDASLTAAADADADADDAKVCKYN